MINLMGVRAVQARIAQLQQQGRFSFRIIRILYTNVPRRMILLFAEHIDVAAQMRTFINH